jgi:hypothetical protein
MIIEKEIESLQDYANFVTARASEGKPFWFRGVRDAENHHLIPSLYRHPTKKKPEQLRELEGQLMNLFKDRAPPFYDRIPANSLELLFFMQHHGVPTRLLDLSENPFAALFFALEVALWEEDGKSTNSAVWMIDPIELNKIAFQNHDGNEKILSANDDLLNAYLPNGPAKNSGKLPIGMYGVHNSRRIVAQRGVFILFGTNVSAIDKEEALIEKKGLMHKLVIKREHKKAVAKALFNMGITDSVIYPDLDGLGREMKSHFEFWRTA